MKTSFLAPSFHLLAPPVSPPRVIGIIMIKPRATFFHSLISRLGKSHSFSFVPCQRGSKFLVFFRGHKLPPLYTFLYQVEPCCWKVEATGSSKVSTGINQKSEGGKELHDFCFVSSFVCDRLATITHGEIDERQICVCVCARAHTRIDNFEEINSRGRNRTRSQVET